MDREASAVVTVLVVIVTGGYALMALGIYLSAWVGVRRKRSYSLAIYIVCTVLTNSPLMADSFPYSARDLCLDCFHCIYPRSAHITV